MSRDTGTEWRIVDVGGSRSQVNRCTLLLLPSTMLTKPPDRDISDVSPNTPIRTYNANTLQQHGHPSLTMVSFSPLLLFTLLITPRS